MEKKRLHIKLPSEIDKILRDLANINGKNITDTLIELIKSTTESKQDNDYKMLDDACIFLDHLYFTDSKKTGLYCTENAPKHIRLGDGSIQDAEKLCKSCRIKKGLIEENKKLKQQIESNTVIPIPSCTQGGRLSDDGKKLWCQRTMQYEDVHKWCKVVKNGANCEYLRWTQIEVKGKLPGADNK